MDAPIVELVKDFRFEAAHYLPNVAAGHKCRRMHGHSFRGEVAVRGPIDPRVGPVVLRLDHYLLNEIEGLENPTSERIAVWMWQQLAPSLPQLTRVTIEESCTSRCSYFGV
jgi:6-pyruvoyltetrahydropterin/6-carboxytetrahydropterin synthase